MKEKLKEQQTHLARMEATGETEISVTDPDQRLTEGKERLVVGYNGQIAVAARSKLIVAYDVCHKALDHHQLASLAQQIQQALCVERLRIVEDKGYFVREQVRRGVDDGITPYVPQPEKAEGAGERVGISPEVYSVKCAYDPSTDTAVCPAGRSMTPIREYRVRWRQRPYGVNVKVRRTDQVEPFRV